MLLKEYEFILFKLDPFTPQVNFIAFDPMNIILIRLIYSLGIKVCNHKKLRSHQILLSRSLKFYFYLLLCKLLKIFKISLIIYLDQHANLVQLNGSDMTIVFHREQQL